MQYIPRPNYKERARELFSSFPVLAVLGPRQAGKTTLVQGEFAECEYLDLELPSDFTKISTDIELYLSSRTGPVIIDEAQRLPELFPVLRSMVDRKGAEPGQFIILGSASFELSKQISESLSGRVAFLDLGPLLLPEIYGVYDLTTHWLKGGFPRALLEGKQSELNYRWFEFYSRTLIEQDLPALGIDLDAILFRRLWAMLSHFHGQLLNVSKVASSLGISPHTAERYLSLLEMTFHVRRLAPFHANLKKRLVKTPKLYFRDSGLFHYFSRITDSEDLLTNPNRGASFEGYVIELLIQSLSLRDDPATPYFFRTSDDYEVDLFLYDNKTITAIEVKCSLAPKLEELKGLQKAIELLPVKHAVVLTLGSDCYPLTESIHCCGIEALASRLFEPFWLEL